MTEKTGFAVKMAAKGNPKASASDEEYDLYADPKKSRGQKIMEMAEIILPAIKKWLKDARDEDGMLLHQARYRAIALHAAQAMMQDYDAATGAAGA